MYIDGLFAIASVTFDLSVTLCLDSNFGEKRKESKGRAREGREGKGKEKKRKVALVCLGGGKGRERKGDRVFPSNLFGKIDILTKIFYPILQIHSLPFCYSNKGSLIPPFPFSPFSSIQTHPKGLLEWCSFKHVTKILVINFL